MASTIVDPSLYGSPATSVSSGYQTNTPDKTRLSHNGEDPGGGIGEEGSEDNSSIMPSKEAIRQSLKDVMR